MWTGLWVLLATVAAGQDAPSNVAIAAQVFAEHGIVADPGALGGARGITMVGLKGSGLGFDGRVIYADFTLAAGLGGGSQFAYDAEVLLGAGSWLTDNLGVAAGGGLGGNSVHQRLPAALRVPLRATVWAQHPDAFTLELFGGLEYITSASSLRKGGATTIDGLDELKWGANVYLGRPGYADQDPRLGVAVGFTWYEVMGTRIYEVRIAAASASRPENKPKKTRKKRRRRQRDRDVVKPPKPPSGPRLAGSG